MANIAVIGAGIGGCSAAYFARKQFPNAKVTLYEAQDRLGGRILTRKVGGVNFEVGAAFFNDNNQTIAGLVKAEQLKIRRLEERLDFAVWNGSEFIFRSNKQPAVTDVKLLARYRMSLARTLLLIKDAKKKYAKLYREAQKNPGDMGELFEAAGFEKWCSKRFDEVLLEAGVSQAFIDEVAAPITRTIYTQNVDIGALAGIASLIGVYSDAVYSLADGNTTLPTHLAEASNSTLKLGQKVNRIEKTSQEAYRVYVGEDVAVFDSVIIAAPIDFTGIEFDGFPKPDRSPQPYRTVYRRMARGIFNLGYFGLKRSASPPATVLTTKDVDPLTQFSIQNAGNGESFVTVSSPEPLKEDVFRSIFKGDAATIMDHRWKAAYPIFKPIGKLPPTKLDECVIYLNAIEPSVSSMETAAFSALNAVGLLAGKFK